MVGDDKKGIPSLFDSSEDEMMEGEKTRLAAELRFAPRAATAVPWLVVVGGQRSVGQVFELRQRMTIGRAGTDIVIDEEGVSRVHAQVELLNGGVVRVSDLGSSNGIRVGGRLTKIHSLRDGERLRLGDAVLTLIHLDAAAKTVAANLHTSANAILQRG